MIQKKKPSKLPSIWFWEMNGNGQLSNVRKLDSSKNMGVGFSYIDIDEFTRMVRIKEDVTMGCLECGSLENIEQGQWVCDKCTDKAIKEWKKDEKN